METRKRAITEVDEPAYAKKRVLIDVRGSPVPHHVNGSAAETDEPKDDNLERFRKEAIYRRMKHYSREHTRGQARITELERRRQTCEAGAAALEACWTQLLDTIKTLVHPEDAVSTQVQTRDLFDLSTHVSDAEPQLSEALRGKRADTERLLSTIIARGAPSAPSLLQNELFRKCQKVQTECAALHSEVVLLRSKLVDAETQKRRYHADLVAAETRAERLQSQTVAAAHGRPSSQPIPAQDGTDTRTEAEGRHPAVASSPATPHPLTNGVHSPWPLEQREDGVPWEEIAEMREKRIVELENDNARLRQAISSLELETKVPSEENVRASLSYLLLVDHASHFEHVANESLAEVTKLKTEVRELREARQQSEEALTEAHKLQVQELKLSLAKRNEDLVRLREQRDQQMSELAERKHKDAVKMASLAELQSLAESRSERIGVLQSEVARLKTRLAAEAGEADLMAFLFRTEVQGNGEASYMDNLQARLRAAEKRTAALEASLTSFKDSGHDVDIPALVASEADARRRIADAAEELARYRATYGEPSTLPADVATLAERLAAKEEELRRLKLQETQHEQAETALYAELDKLSAAWEALDRQVKSKVFDLSAMEEKVAKAGVEKAKSENKYYSAMRDKEAVENERKNLSRNLEKQAKAIERLVASEKSLAAQVADLEKESLTSKDIREAMKERVRVLDKELSDLKKRLEHEKKRYYELMTVSNARERAVGKQSTELRRAEEGAARARKDLERAAATKPKTVGTGSTKEAELQGEVDKCMVILKCSTCKMRMRNTVITKCMHSFCKDCVDARIATRQRKCPACNLAFAQSDVQQVFFQ